MSSNLFGPWIVMMFYMLLSPMMIISVLNLMTTALCMLLALVNIQGELLRLWFHLLGDKKD